VFRIALDESGFGFVRRWLMWTAVSLATWWSSGWKWRAVFILFVGWLVAVLGSWGYTLITGEWAWFGGPWYLAPALALLLIGLLFGPARAVMAIVGVLLVAVPTVLVWVTIFVVWVIHYVAARVGWLVSRAGSGPTPEWERPPIGPQRNQVKTF
jgi:hypothetical protein